ncbi:GNAT family N-acetyltransferase [Streptomyces minutiscleroticus]|uniref:GNAT family N-acetyltransferase n=1 Tax=Streptomyces minutiscleroticus TaxID=68238 RepID=UPI00331E0696
MASTDTSTGAGTAAPHARTAAPGAEGPDAGAEDTLDLRLPDGFPGRVPPTLPVPAPSPARSGLRSGAEPGPGRDGPRRPPAAPVCGGLLAPLLGRVEEWGPVTTAVGVLRLVPVHGERDVPLVSRWMNDPAVAPFWGLAGPEAVTARHVRARLDGDGRAVPCLGLLDGTPMSYWEIHRADLDVLARHCPLRPHDTGVRLLVGGVGGRGRGVGSTLLKAVADLVLDRRPSCARVLGDPDLRNAPYVSAFLGAGFRFSAEVDLPDRRAALMIRDRALRDVL